MTTRFVDLLLNPVTGDLDLTNNSISLIEDNVISLRQRLLFRFSIWQGEWYFDESFGFPYRNYISKKVLKRILDNKIRETVNLEPDVVSINNFRSKITGSTRSYEAYFEVTTRQNESVYLAFLGRDPFNWPNPDDNETALCDKDGNITFANRLHYLINFRLPTWGDLTWINKWSGDIANNYLLTLDTNKTYYTPDETIYVTMVLSKDSLPVKQENMVFKLLDQSFIITTNDEGTVELALKPSDFGKNEWAEGQMNITVTYNRETGSPVIMSKNVMIDRPELVFTINGSNQPIEITDLDIITISGQLTSEIPDFNYSNYVINFYDVSGVEVKLDFSTTTDNVGFFTVDTTVPVGDYQLQAVIEDFINN